MEHGDRRFEQFCAASGIPLLRLDWPTIQWAVDRYGAGATSLSTRELCDRALAPTPLRVQLNVLTLVVAGFSLISRCTHRAHGALYLVDKPELSLQSIMGKFELGPANAIKRNLSRTTQRPLCATSGRSEPVMAMLISAA